MRRIGGWLVTVLLATLAVSCGAGGGSGERVQVAATTSVIQDMVQRVGGDRIEAFSIVPVGGSPETFQASPRDAGRISESRVVFENGLGLDSWIQDLLESAGNEEQTVVVLSEGLPTLEGGDYGVDHAGEASNEHEAAGAQTEGNPHLWLDVANAEHYVEHIRDTLVELDPEGAEQYEANVEEYLGELEELDGYIREKAEGIPLERRKLVTLHDAFPYFAEAYGFELTGAVLENPEAEPGSREIADVVRKIQEEEVPAVFTEPQFNSALAETIAQEAGVKVSEVYTDTLVDDQAGSTYEAMMRTDIERISEALS